MHSQLDKDNTNEARQGEEPSFHFRSSRLITVNGQWYFDTRENTHIGPFSSEATASDALKIYLREITSALSSDRAAKSRASNGNWSVTHYQ